MSDDPTQFLAQSRSYDSNPAFRFNDIGDEINGTILNEPRVIETDDLDGGRTPKLVLDIETNDGTYSLWLPRGKRITQAVADAVKDAGATNLEPGGTLRLKHTGLGEQPKAGFNPPKLFKAAYTTPTPVALDDF